MEAAVSTADVIRNEATRLGRRSSFASGRRKWLPITVCLGMLLLLFGLFEAGLRVVGAQPKTATVLSAFFHHDASTGWRGTPNVSMTFVTASFAAKTSHGPDGFRKLSRALPEPSASPDGSREIWVLGDSGTWGWGAADGQTYIDRLNEQSDGFVLRNLGQCGFSSLQEYLLLKDLLDGDSDRRPAAVFVLFCANDLAENVNGADQDPPRAYCAVAENQVVVKNHPVPDDKQYTLRGYLKRSSLAFNYLSFYLAGAKQALGNQAAGGSMNSPPLPPAKQWRVLTYVYRQIKRLCEEQRIPLTMILIPPLVPRSGHSTTADMHEYDETIRREFLSRCGGLDIPVIDLTDAFREYFLKQGPGAEPLCFIDDPHFTVRGHRLIADGIRERLSSSGTLVKWLRAGR
jgi:lysophospholipase L1-like esterase